jgi:hypothetical protein
VTAADLDAPPQDAPGVANDPVRRDYRVVLQQCEDVRSAHEEELTDAQRRRRRQTAAAAAAYAVGEATDVQDDSDVPLDGVGGQDPCPRDRDPNRAGPCVTPTPTVAGTPNPSPAQAQVDEVQSEALIELRSIDQAISEADDFLFSNPEPREWSAEEREEWLARRNRLAQLCDYTAPGPWGGSGVPADEGQIEIGPDGEADLELDEDPDDHDSVDDDDDATADEQVDEPPRAL